jgi:shikimate kinase / 3-dehydroquinate synthase
MDLVIVGLPGSGKSVVGKRVAQRHSAAFVDLDEVIEDEAHRTIPEIFALEGEAAFRAREHAAVLSVGAPDPDRRLRRVIATGGGTPVDPRNRWLLYRGRIPVWLDSRPEVLAQRLRRSRNVRPLIAGRDPIAALRGLSADRERFYAAGARLNSVAEIRGVVDGIEELLAAGPRDGTMLLAADIHIGRFVIGDGIAGHAIAEALRRHEARRAIVVTEPVAWSIAAPDVEPALAAAGLPLHVVLLPEGEAAKRLAVIEEGARALAELRAERSEPLVAIGGGALGDAAGFLAATWLRGVPVIHVPTTLVAQIDSSIGGKTAVDLPQGKNLVGAFHQPTDIVIDIRFLESLPERQRRAALGEAVKMAALGDERLFALLESDGDAVARGERSAFERGAVAELVERAAWAKVEVVSEDEHEHGARIHLNLGHTVGHAIEAAAGYESILHGEAVAYGLRAAARIGVAMEVTPPGRAARIEDLLTKLHLAVAPLPWSPDAIRTAMGTDKKHAAGRLRWVLPTEAGVTVRADVPAERIDSTLGTVLAGTAGRAPASAAPTAAGEAR